MSHKSRTMTGQPFDGIIGIFDELETSGQKFFCRLQEFRGDIHRISVGIRMFGHEVILYQFEADSFHDSKRKQQEAKGVYDKKASLKVGII